MNVGIDITSLIYQRGVSRYTANLIRALDRYTNVNLRLFGYSLRKNSFLKEKTEECLIDPDIHQIKIQACPPKMQSVVWKLGLNKLSSHFDDLDLIHSWDWLQPPDKDIPLVSTIHDLAILRFDEVAHARVLTAHHKSWKILKKRQAEIIAVSRATRKDVIELLQYPQWKVHVVHSALPADVREISQEITENKAKNIKEKLRLDQPYLFFVGTQEPRKNLKKLIQAWQPLADQYQLIIAGDRGWDASEKMFHHPNLRFLGRVSDEELNILYAEADVFCYPSLYEGFGLPILESFLHGTPVVTSNLSSMVEVAGNAAELVNPESVESIHQGISNVLNENADTQRKRLQRMIIRQQMFSWEQTALKTVEVYQQTIKHFQNQKNS
ncbi:MAG: glycosyltransferase family 1 protein [Patescibacteria group bacterium]|nr:glycosyltransferase family 1 protein [Patescibacteria group bacterium]